MTELILKKKVPIIGEVFEQELIINFKKGTNGTGMVSFSFNPPMDKAENAEQKAALNIANQIITLLQLEGEQQNAASTPTEQ